MGGLLLLGAVKAAGGKGRSGWRGAKFSEGMWTARLKVMEEQKEKPRRQREEARGQVGKRDTSEEVKREGRTREWRGRCGTKQDKREACLQSDRRFTLGWEERGACWKPKGDYYDSVKLLIKRRGPAAWGRLTSETGTWFFPAAEVKMQRAGSWRDNEEERRWWITTNESPTTSPSQARAALQFHFFHH